MKTKKARVIAVTDCGSTTTKAILIEEIDGVYRQTCRGDAPTTVEAPVEDVTEGVVAALEDLSAMSGRRIIGDDKRIITPADNTEGVDVYLSTSSAGGGLQMLVAGVVRRISAESAERAALGAGAIVADVVACDDGRPLHEQIERMRKLRPDMVLLAGGVDGGAEVQVVEMAEMLKAADPRPRFGRDFKLPVIYAGNREVRGHVEETLGDTCDFSATDNLRPAIDQEHLGPARERIHDLFLDHVMRQAPGFSKLVEWTDAPVMPTPSAVGEILHAAAETRDISLICVDIGGATTDIFSVVKGAFTRTVSANLGLSYSAANVLAESGYENILSWLPFDLEKAELCDQVMNKTIRPTTIPDSTRDLLIEQALAREALRLSLEQHLFFATGLKGGLKERSIAGAFKTADDDKSFELMEVDLIIGSGGVLSHAPRPWQTAAMLVDSFLPEGVTRLAKDSIFMMPHLGVLWRLMPQAAQSVFERDCLKDLGVCVAPVGAGRPGKPCLEYRVQGKGGRVEEGELRFGELKVLPFHQEGTALELTPTSKFDVGAGKGKKWSGTVRSGPAGLILDGRGRPLQRPSSTQEAKERARRWLDELGRADSREVE